MDLQGRELPSPSKIEWLYGHCYEISRVDQGDQIPLGGHVFSDDASNLGSEVNVDVDQIRIVLDEMHGLAQGYNLEELRKYLDTNGIHVGEKTFAALFAFTKIMEKRYPHNPDRETARAKLYNSKKGVTLSQVFEQNLAECGEVALLAQLFLQESGIQSTFFSGDVLWQKNAEFSNPHSFIPIRTTGKTLIFDPYNPVDTTQGMFPSINTTDADFNKEVRRNTKRFITVTDILSKKQAFFGVNGRSNVSPENII